MLFLNSLGVVLGWGGVHYMYREAEELRQGVGDVKEG